jgi:beta-mannosidase
VRWSLETLSGEVLVDGMEEVLAAPLSSTKVCSLDFVNRITGSSAALGADTPRNVVFVAELWQGDERATISVATFCPNKHLELVDPDLSFDLIQQDDELVCQVAAQSLARFVELSLVGVDAVWSDNYFDVPAGRMVSVTCPLPEGWTLDRAREALRARSLYNSFA